MKHIKKVVQGKAPLLWIKWAPCLYAPALPESIVRRIVGISNREAEEQFGLPEKLLLATREEELQNWITPCLERWLW